MTRKKYENMYITITFVTPNRSMFANKCSYLHTSKIRVSIFISKKQVQLFLINPGLEDCLKLDSASNNDYIMTSTNMTWVADTSAENHWQWHTQALGFSCLHNYLITKSKATESRTPQPWILPSNFKEITPIPWIRLMIPSLSADYDSDRLF